MSWFVEAFGPWYPIVYPHRDGAEAERLVRALEGVVTLDGVRLLDVGCGAGRHLARFAAAGSRPVGLDLSPTLLVEARAARREARGAWPLVRGDMRRLPVRSAAFGCVTSLFTSFGYFDVEGDRGVLAEAARALAPGGFHVLDFLNRERVLAHPNPRTDRTRGDWRVIEERRVEADRRIVKRVVVEPASGGPAVADYEERVTLYGRDELVALLAEAGLQVRHVWGEHDGSPFDPEHSSRLILVSDREKG